MIAKIKNCLRRTAQKITGLDADNAELERMRLKISGLETELQSIKTDFLYSPRLIPDVLSNFIEPKDLFSKENKFINELESLGLINKECNVLELMCGSGENAASLKGKICSYTGFDSSEILIKFLKKRFPEMNFISNLDLIETGYDLVIISSSTKKWSKISIQYHVELVKNILKPNATVIVMLPYPDLTISDLEPEFEKLRYENISFLIARNINSKPLVSNL